MPASRALLIVALVAFLGVTVWLDVTLRTEQQFSFLARAFLQGELGFVERPGSWADTTPFHGQNYWPLGPLPAVVLMPFVLLAGAGGELFSQGYLQPFLVVVVLALVYSISRRTGFSQEDSAYLAFGFAFSTAFLGVAMWPWSWYFSQVLTCTLVLAAIYEMTGSRRPWLLGGLFALTLATRVTAALGIVWCIGALLLSDLSPRRKLSSLAAYAAPCLFVAIALLLYNHARFGDALEQGYAQQIIPASAAASRAYGVMSLLHVPANLYHLLLAAPWEVRADDTSLALRFPYVAANPWGMSLFLTSPCFLRLFTLRHPDATSRLLVLTVLVIALPILLYYGVGFRQFGYRYALDFLPFLYYLLLRSYRRERGDLSPRFKALLLGSAIFNFYLFAGHFLPLRVG